MKRIIAAIAALLLSASVALAQGSSVTNHAFEIGTGGVGSRGLLCAANTTVLGGGASTDPVCTSFTLPSSTAAGTILSSLTANTVTASATPTLGIAGTTLGTLSFAGNTSGTATIRPQAAAGTPTLTFPNASGTFGVSATSPVTLNATSGDIGCATCATTSSGGAITGVAPVAVSGAGAISITGAAGMVLGGATPGFTATPTLGASGTLGSLTLGNATSGLLTLQTVTGALGTVTLSLPAATDTLVGKATTDTFTNKTYDTAGAGNSFSINGVAATANTGTGAVARATSPTFVTPILGAAAATSLDLGTAGAALGTLTLSGNTSGTVTVRPAAAAGTWTMTLPTDDGSVGNVLTTDGSGVTSWGTAGSGDVVGPASATDNAAVRFDSTTGKLIQNSALIIADTTGSLSRSGGGGIPIQGTNTNDSAAAGYVGEYTSQSLAIGSAVSLTNNTAATFLTFSSLSAGDWDIQCTAVFNGGVTTNTSYYGVGISQTTNTMPTTGTGAATVFGTGGTTVYGVLSNHEIASPVVRVSLAGATNVYCVGVSGFTVSTTVLYGYGYARRVR